ncbi:MAG: universal stress protein [Cytophagales bacterium]|nr:universal stress protein [Cytophagales bacterium]
MNKPLKALAQEMNTLLLALDLSAMDHRIITQALYLAKKARPEKVYCLHVVKSYEHLDKKEYVGDEQLPVNERIEKTIDRMIPKELKLLSDVHIEVHEGPIIKTILRWIKLKNADAVIIGNKEGKYHEDYLPAQVANFSRCSVVMIPEASSSDFQNLLVPIDFSEHAAHAVYTANFISDHNVNHPKVNLINIFEVPSGYHAVGKSFDEFAEVIRDQHKREFDEFLVRFHMEDQDLSCEYILDQEGNVAKAIASYAKKNKIDGIIMGAKGRTHLASMLVGSVAKRLIRLGLNFPLIVVKAKEDQFNLMNDMWEI